MGGQRGNEGSRAASAGPQLVRRDYGLDQVRQGAEESCFVLWVRAINSSHRPSMDGALRGLLFYQYGIPSVGLPGTEPAPMNDMLCHANGNTCIHVYIHGVSAGIFQSMLCMIYACTCLCC